MLETHWCSTGKGGRLMGLEYIGTTPGGVVEGLALEGEGAVSKGHGLKEKHIENNMGK